MKKLLSAFLAGMLLFSAVGCAGNSAANEEDISPPAQPVEQAGGNSAQPQGPDMAEENEPIPADTATGKSLVVYFSATGNTRAAAETLAELQGADLYEIVPEQPYTEEDLNYRDSAARASVEQNDETARPAITGSIDNLGDYDVIYIGFPIWWGDIPRVLHTFFDTYDFSGKVIAPFCTSGGSGISTAVQSIVELEPGAEVTEGVRASASDAEEELRQWLYAIALAEQA